MTIFEFQKELDDSVRMFKAVRSEYGRSLVTLCILKKCTNEFEKQCVIERLREEAS